MTWTRDWWHGRSRREQMLLATLAMLVTLAILLIGIVRPLQEERGAALADIRTYQALAGRLHTVSLATGPAQRSGPPAVILAQTAAEVGLPAPNVTGPLATVDAAPYDAALRWVAVTEATSALRLVRLSIAPTSRVGLVSVRATWR